MRTIGATLNDVTRVWSATQDTPHLVKILHYPREMIEMLEPVSSFWTHQYELYIRRQAGEFYDISQVVRTTLPTDLRNGVVRCRYNHFVSSRATSGHALKGWADANIGRKTRRSYQDLPPSLRSVLLRGNAQTLGYDLIFCPGRFSLRATRTPVYRDGR